jgi:hypothetical protein
MDSTLLDRPGLGKDEIRRLRALQARRRRKLAGMIVAGLGVVATAGWAWLLVQV